jgi:hypothetical protein
MLIEKPGGKEMFLLRDSFALHVVTCRKENVHDKYKINVFKLIIKIILIHEITIHRLNRDFLSFPVLRCLLYCHRNHVRARLSSHQGE